MASIECVEDFDGVLRGFVAEYDREGRLRNCARLPSRFKKENKGFEGLALACRDGQIAIVSQESARLWVGQLDAKSSPIPRSD